MRLLITKETFKDLCETAYNGYNIEASLYDYYNVKRGLRNPDGSGVMTGLTNIGEVHGYVMSEGELMPVPGTMAYRGIDLNEIVEGCIKEKRHGFDEVCHLLLVGTLPTKQRLEAFQRLIGVLRKLPYGFTEDMILKAPSNDIMNKLARCVLVSYSYDKDPEDMSFENIMRQSIELIASFPTMAAYAYQAKAHYHDGKSLFIHGPREDLTTAENFLYLIRPNCEYTEMEAQVLDLALMLHAEHGGGNNSAFTTHVVSSSGTDTYSAISAAIGSLKGPRHGGANAKVMAMIEDIKANCSWTRENEVADYLVKLLKKEGFDKSGLIYGLGHAVYTISDPRAVMLRDRAKLLAEEKGDWALEELELYLTIERIGPQLFAQVRNSSKSICANVDLFSGFVYKMMGIPPELYTPIFAISRMVGWCAHRIEEWMMGGRIIRPAYKSVCKRSKYVSLEGRG